MFELELETLNPEVVASFTIDGEPRSKERPRWNPTRSTQPYTPEKTVKAEKEIGWLFRKAAGPFPVSSTDTFGVFAVFLCGTKRRQDTDNMLKLVLDGLNGVAWKDDMQVTESPARLVRGVLQARTEVLVYRTAGCVSKGASNENNPEKEFTL
ncbi:MAG: RusA family crossover junction endodeoxyribonuclease [Candidatus Dormibacteria bacterium]